MDAVMVVCTAKRQVSYLMAEASWKRRLIGDFAWALGVVPVKRAQDDAKPGTGTIRFGSMAGASSTTTTKTTTTTESASSTDPAEESPSSTNVIWRVTGSGTSFLTDLAPGDKIRPPSTAHGLKVIKVESDTELLVDATGLPDNFPTANLLSPTTAAFVPYDVLKHTPLNKVFEKVLDRLAAGGALGIFPEGGSSDRTDLLPLKIGVSLIAYSALDKDGLNIPIVPVGLNYYRAHRWRGRAVVEYGRPIQIDPATLADYQAGGTRRRTVCNALLEQVETAMRSVIVAAPDYDDLQTMLTARRLFQRKRGVMSTKETLELTRRFAEGSKRMMLLNDGDLDEEGQELRDRLVAYRDALDDLGLKDYQVQALTEERLLDDDDHVVDGDRMLRFLQLTYNIVHKLILICVSAIPLLLLNLPVGVLAGVYAERRRKKALANSKVKVKGYDVMLTEKVVFSVVAVPTLWFIYGLLLRFGTSLDGAFAVQPPT
jgi:glycerol-3-phosphate O-acyltransferase / dihydroxyacetone phosphate acyltransferase